jgi:hypothetical protein
MRGRKRADVSVSVTAFVATTPEEENFARAQISFYASTPSYRPVFALHGWEDVAEKLSKHAAKGEWGEMFGLVTDEILETFCLVTDAESLPAKLKERYKGHRRPADAVHALHAGREGCVLEEAGGGVLTAKTRRAQRKK